MLEKNFTMETKSTKKSLYLNAEIVICLKEMDFSVFPLKIESSTMRLTFVILSEMSSTI